MDDFVKTYQQGSFLTISIHMVRINDTALPREFGRSNTAPRVFESLHNGGKQYESRACDPDGEDFVGFCGTTPFERACRT
jgi:hypothetical protein